MDYQEQIEDEAHIERESDNTPDLAMSAQEPLYFVAPIKLHHINEFGAIKPDEINVWFTAKSAIEDQQKRTTAERPLRVFVSYQLHPSVYELQPECDCPARGIVHYFFTHYEACPHSEPF